MDTTNLSKHKTPNSFCFPKNTFLLSTSQSKIHWVQIPKCISNSQTLWSYPKVFFYFQLTFRTLATLLCSQLYQSLYFFFFCDDWFPDWPPKLVSGNFSITHSTDAQHRYWRVYRTKMALHTCHSQEFRVLEKKHTATLRSLQGKKKQTEKKVEVHTSS